MHVHVYPVQLRLPPPLLGLRPAPPTYAWSNAHAPALKCLHAEPNPFLGHVYKRGARVLEKRDQRAPPPQPSASPTQAVRVLMARVCLPIALAAPRGAMLHHAAVFAAALELVCTS